MFLSKHKNGTYYIYFNSNSGKRNKISTKCKRKADAIQSLQNFKALESKQSELKTIEISYLHFIIKFLAHSEVTHSWNHTLSIRTTLNELYKYLKKDQPISSLTKETIINFIEYRQKKVSPHAVRRDIADLSSVFNWAITKNYMRENLVKGIKKPRIPEKLPAYFTKEEFDTLITKTEDVDLKDIITFGVMTGIRQSDLISLEWTQINFQANSIILDNRFKVTKSHKVHSIPMNETALCIVNRRQGRKQSNYVFTYQGKPIKQHFISHKFTKLIKSAGLNYKLTFHSLRHTFATWMVQKGVPIYQVSKLMTHSDLRVTQIYVHLRSDDLRSAVESLD